MDQQPTHRSTRGLKIAILIAVLILAAGLVGWLIGRQNTKQSAIGTSQPAASTQTDGTGVSSLVSYTLPSGWKDATCPASPNAVFITPAGGAPVNCDNPSSPIKISEDAANNTDCNQLQNVQNVSKHICISEFINGKKSLKAETIYNSDSSYKKPTTINAYYINLGSKVVKVEYVHAPDDNAYQAAYDELAKGVQAK